MNPFNRKLLCRILNKHNVEVIEASNGLEAINKIKEIPFDLVLMDMRMPVMDGLEATRKIVRHTDKRISANPVFALTAATTNEEKERNNGNGN